MVARLRSAGRFRIDPGTAAIAALAVAWGLVMHAMGWGQLANYAQVRAFAEGEIQIDRWHWETKDKAWIDGHFYSVKAPGLAAVTLPAYMAVDGVGGQRLAKEAAANINTSNRPRWVGDVMYPYSEHGYSPRRAVETENQVAQGAPIVWALTLFGAVIPAVLLLLLVRRIADRIEPGYGTAAAITLGLGTIVMTFASEYFPHIFGAMLAFAAFAVLFRERRYPPRTLLVGAAGLLAGLAVLFEYPMGIAGAVLFVYALARSDPRLPRAAAYAAGAVAGALPALLFNAWAFGSPLKFAYGDAVVTQGLNGHAVLGLNDGGLFGITFPDVGAALDLLFQARGLLTLTPVIAMGIAGVWLMRGRGYRAESNVILAVAGAYFLYDTAYWLPFGGGTPGPRFLIPMLPFVALGFAPAWKRWPALTLALAVPSALFMVAASLTHPLIGWGDTGRWIDQLTFGELEHTLLTAFGVEQAWLASAPVVLATAAAVGLAVAATPSVQLGSVRTPVRVIAAWACVAAIASAATGDPVDLWLLVSGVLGSTATLFVLRYRERRSEPAEESLLSPGPALSEGIS